MLETSSAPADQTTPTEEWRAIPGYPPYEVSSVGRIRRNGRIRKQQKNAKGYRIVGLSRRRVRVASAVAEAFIGPRPAGMQVNHKNGVKSDNRVSNLEYVTPSENNRHAIRLGLYSPPRLRGEQIGTSKLTDEKVIDARARWAGGEKITSIARSMGVHRVTIALAVRRERWKHV